MDMDPSDTSPVFRSRSRTEVDGEEPCPSSDNTPTEQVTDNGRSGEAETDITQTILPKCVSNRTDRGDPQVGPSSTDIDSEEDDEMQPCTPAPTPLEVARGFAQVKSESLSTDEDEDEDEEDYRPAIVPKGAKDLLENRNGDPDTSEEEDEDEEADLDSLIFQTVSSIAEDLVSRIVNADKAESDLENEHEAENERDKAFGRGRPRKRHPSIVQACANCNAPYGSDSSKGKAEGHQRVYFRESLPLMITIREEDEGRRERKREVIVYDALVDIFQLRWKPTQSKLLNVAMESDKELFVCNDCATRLAHLYEEYNEFTQLARRTGSFLSPILLGQTGIKTELEDEEGMDIAGQNVAVVYDNDFEGNDSYESYEDRYRNGGPMSVQFVDQVNTRRLQRKRLRACRQFLPKPAPSSVDGDEGTKKRRRNSLKLQCPTCAKEYLNAASYEKHLRLHRRKKRVTNAGEPKRRVGRPRKVVSAVDIKPNYREIGEDEPFGEEDDQNVKVGSGDEYVPSWARRQVSCAECGKKFMSHGHLMQHMKTHTKDKNSCKKCEKTFRYPCELKEHMDCHRKKEGDEDEMDDDEGAGPSIQDDSDSDGEQEQASENENANDVDETEKESVPSELEEPDDSDESEEYEPRKRQKTKRRRGRPRKKPLKDSTPSTSTRSVKKPSEPVTCPECQREFRHPSFLQQHMQVHNKKFVCNQCNQEFQDARGLREHKAEHRREKRANIEPMPCKYCGRQYYDDIRLFRHEETHELPPPSHKCDQCTRTFRRKDTLTSHMATAHTTDCPFECPSCEKKYPRRDKLNRHIARKHGEVKGCDQCGKSFIGEAALKAHQITHFFEKPRELVCHVCGRKYQNLKYLKNHIKFMHTKRNAHACSLCSKTFGRFSCLQKHLIVHQEVGSFLCVHCGKCFKRERSLKQHEQKAHLGESSYENICPICSKRFHRIDLLKAHQVKEGHLEPVPEPPPRPSLPPPPPPSSTGSPEPRFGMYDPGNHQEAQHNMHIHSHSAHSSNDSFPHAHSHGHGHGHGHPISNMHPAHVHHPSGSVNDQMHPSGLPPSLAPDFLFAGLNMNMAGMPYSYERH